MNLIDYFLRPTWLNLLNLCYEVEQLGLTWMENYEPSFYGGLYFLTLITVPPKLLIVA